MTVTIIVVLELILCAGWISQSNAQGSATLFPYEHQSVCRGQSISYDCSGNGVLMVFFSPPIVNDSRPLGLLTSAPVLAFRVQDSAATVKFLESSGNSSIALTFTLFISDKQSEGQRSVFCRVTDADGIIVTNSTTFSVLGAPDLETVSSIQLSMTAPLKYNDADVEQVAVNISWDSPVNAQEFTLTISNTTNGYTSTIRSLENRVTVLLPYGTYSAYLCVINLCGKECKDFPSKLLVERQSQQGADDDADSALLAAAIIAGVMGVLFIVAVTFGVVMTIKWYIDKIEK